MGYATTTFLSYVPLPHEAGCNFLRRGLTERCGRGEERLMGLSRETVIVRGWWTNQLMDLPAMGGGGTGQWERRQHCVSLQFPSSDTQLIVHLNMTALSAARQRAHSPRRTACPPAYPTSCHPRSSFLRLDCPNLPGAQTAAEEVRKLALHFKCLSQIP